jgi:RNA polymerase-interacting CarD/CdnL/TRCF family regulator
MVFQIGDKVIHMSHGLGEIVNIEEKYFHGQTTNCYVFRTPELTVWIPIDDIEQHSLRAPTSPEEFNRLFTILTSPSQALPEDRALRKEQLMAQLRDGQLASICKVVRDLTHFMRTSKPNDQERSILERATKSLLTEWTYALKVPMNQAQQAVEKLLQA